MLPIDCMINNDKLYFSRSYKVRNSDSHFEEIFVLLGVCVLEAGGGGGGGVHNGGILVCRKFLFLRGKLFL